MSTTCNFPEDAQKTQKTYVQSIFFKSKVILSSPHLGVGLQQALGLAKAKSRKRRRIGITYLNRTNC